jgi:MoaA/NifB/PqqE/SkfB family radical SAM enzyme
MANVLLTTKCNLSCPYCFAQERLGDGRKLAMSIENVSKVIDFLKRSGHPYFRAMGGEPTLHPEFPRILKMALEAEMRVDLLSNATWPESYNELFRRISPRRLFFLLNIDHPDRYVARIWEKIEHNLAAVSGRGTITLSFNIFEKQPKHDYILELCSKYHIDKVRMSFSLPVVGANNTYLELADYKSMAPFILEFAKQAELAGVQVSMDNAVPLCMFTFEQAGELLMKGVIDLQRNTRCEPVIDIGPDLRVWCCFCLSKMWNRHLDEFKDLKEIHAYYSKLMAQYQGHLYPLEECSNCTYRDRWGCQGGCLTHAVMKHGELPGQDRPADVPAENLQVSGVLVLSSDIEIQKFDMPAESYSVFNKVTGAELEVDASFQPLLDSLRGQYSAQEVVDRYVDSSLLDSPLAPFAQEAMRKGSTELLFGLMQQGFVVQRAV